MKKRALYGFCLVFLVTNPLAAQSAGDIAFIGFNADSTDNFAIVVLSDLPAGTIYFTDNEWDSASASFTSGEGAYTWTTLSAISAGTVVTFDNTNTLTPSASIGIFTESDLGFDITSQDEALYAFIGTDDSTPTTFLAAISNNDFDNGASVGSLFGTGLTEGTEAVNLGSVDADADVGEYTGLRKALNKPAFLSRIGDAANWTTADGSGNQSASFLPFNSTSFVFSEKVTITGDAGWRMLSFPVDGGTVADISDDTAIQGISGGSNSGSAANIYYNDGSNQNGTASGWHTPADMNTSWGNGLGFIVYFYDNTSAGSSELPLDLDITGAEPTADVTVNLDSTYTLVGNPFDSNIELDLLSGNGVNGGTGVLGGIVSPIHVWNDATSSYETFNIGEGLKISTWQGFFLETGGDTPASILTLPVSAKTDSAEDVSVFSKKHQSWRRINLELRTAGYSDISTKLYYSQHAISGRDAFDGSKLNPLNNAPYIAFVQDAEEEERLLVQDARELNPSEIQSYTLTFNDMGVSGEYTLSWPEWKHIPDDWQFILTDSETGIQTDMRAHDAYVFSVSGQQKMPTSGFSAPKLKAQHAGGSPRFTITLVPGTSVGNEAKDTPEAFSLSQNYPNPFNPSTTIRYTLDQSGLVSLNVYNILGQKVAELINGVRPAGSYTVNWDASSVSSGMYYYRLESGGRVITKTMTLIK